MPTTARPRLYFDNPAGRLWEHPDGYVVFEYLPGKRRFSDLQALLTHTGNLLQRNGWRCLLGDQRLMTPFTDEESHWISSYWLDPTNQRPGGIYAAILLANDVFARLATSQVIHNNKVAALTYRLFEREDEATAWLREVR